MSRPVFWSHPWSHNWSYSPEKHIDWTQRWEQRFKHWHWPTKMMDNGGSPNMTLSTESLKNSLCVETNSHSMHSHHPGVWVWLTTLTIPLTTFYMSAQGRTRDRRDLQGYRGQCESFFHVQGHRKENDSRRHWAFNWPNGNDNAYHWGILRELFFVRYYIMFRINTFAHPCMSTNALPKIKNWAINSKDGPVRFTDLISQSI